MPPFLPPPKSHGKGGNQPPMSQFDSSESDPPDSSPISSGEVETPRGGFMARPGLKAPPRHAVVVRVGDAPQSEEIPIARSSFPPPPSSPPPESLSEKVTLRAIPTPRLAQVVAREAAASTPVLPVLPVAPAAATMAAEPTRLPVVLESVPPPSDAPVVASVEERSSSVPRSRRAARSRFTILAAAMAGLVLGVVSVITTVHVRDADSSSPAAAAPVEGTPLAAAPATTPPAPRGASPVPASSVIDERQAAKREPPAPAPQQAPARGTAAKRSIF
jgi:hypothetical protein